MTSMDKQPLLPPGFLVIDKPSGMSSMRAVAIVRRKAGGLKTGHAGTLDPLATGVLVLALGRATKSIDLVMATSKRYRTVIDFTAFTTTDDREGDRTEVTVENPPVLDDIKNALDRFQGEVMQAPPSFSAMKVNGRRAYKLARSGKPPKLEPRKVIVHSIEIVNYRWPEVELDLHVGKGFYVRSLARDLGNILETGGHCASIRRTAVGAFTLEGAVEPDDLADPLPAGVLIDIDTALGLTGSG
jgi:tRNA pseudouridine55 synthase